MFPLSDDDFYELTELSGSHHKVKDPPLSGELDAHLFVLPPADQFRIDDSSETRIYAVTANYSYFPLNMDLKFKRVGVGVGFKPDGSLDEAVKVPALKRDNRPGIKGRFRKLVRTQSKARCDVGCDWSFIRNGRTLSGDLLAEVETV